MKCRTFGPDSAYPSMPRSGQWNSARGFNPISANLIKASARRMYFSSRRDSTIVAWHEVPGKRPPKEPSRRVRYDRTQLIPEVFLVESASRRTTSIVAWHEMPDDVRAAVRCDGPFPKHLDFFCSHLRNLVTPILQSPNRSAHTGKNQTVPYGTAPWGGDVPGTSCQATIALSLRGLSDIGQKWAFFVFLDHQNSMPTL